MPQFQHFVDYSLITSFRQHLPKKRRQHKQKLCEYPTDLHNQSEDQILNYNSTASRNLYCYESHYNLKSL